MGHGVVCRQCSIISRGIVGNCRHVEDEVLEAIAVERRQFEPLINTLIALECQCPIVHGPCIHERAQRLREKLHWTVDPANGVYEFPDDFGHPSMLPEGLSCAPVQPWPSGTAATFDDTHPQFVLFSRTFLKNSDRINLYIEGAPPESPDIASDAALQLSWREVREGDRGERLVGSLHSAVDFNYTCEVREGTPDPVYLWSSKVQIPMMVQAGVRCDFILGRAALLSADSLIGDFYIRRIRIEEE